MGCIRQAACAVPGWRPPRPLQLPSKAARKSAPSEPFLSFKRDRSSSSAGSSDDAPSKRRALEQKASPIDSIIDSISPSAAKDLLRTLSRDPAIEAVVKSHIHARERSILQRQFDAICDESDQALARAETDALEMKGMAESSEFGAAQSRFLPRIRRLLHFRDAKLGSELAWKASLHIANNAMYELDGGDARVQGGEEDNDFLHQKIDKLMLQSCKMLAEEDPAQVEGRYGEVDLLKDRTKGYDRRLEYRYKRTVKYLQSLNEKKAGSDKEHLTQDVKNDVSEVLDGEKVQVVDLSKDSAESEDSSQSEDSFQSADSDDSSDFDEPSYLQEPEDSDEW